MAVPESYQSPLMERWGDLCVHQGRIDKMVVDISRKGWLWTYHGGLVSLLEGCLWTYHGRVGEFARGVVVDISRKGW